MPRQTPLFALIMTGVFALAPALAHDGVTNPTVMARMMMMEDIRNDFRVIGEMAQGKTAFDPTAAARARRRLIAAANDMPAAFRVPQGDPKSAALPEIWDSYDDFIAKATMLGRAAKAVKTNSAVGLAAGFKSLAATCRSCHASYRARK